MRSKPSATAATSGRGIVRGSMPRPGPNACLRLWVLATGARIDPEAVDLEGAVPAAGVKGEAHLLPAIGRPRRQRQFIGERPLALVAGEAPLILRLGPILTG